MTSALRVPFAKMEGCGNDYVYVDAIAAAFPRARAPELARRWSDRHFGIGADGLVLLEPSSAAAVGMAMWNADGSLGAICGNGLRCLAKFARERGHVAADRFTVETGAGVRRVELVRDGAGAIAGARVDLGRVRVEPEPLQLRVGDRRLACHRGDAGNPHAVVVLDADPDGFPVDAIGSALQTHAAFPDGVNVEFVQVLADGTLRQRTFERGSGETMACGSGAAVAALLAVRAGLLPGPDVRVRLRGGDLDVHCGDGLLVIAGPARTVFTGEIEIEPLA